MQDPIFTLAMFQTRPGELLKEADEYRLLEMARADRPWLQGRLLPGLGDVLISFGLRLKARYEPNSAAPLLRPSSRPR